MPWLSRRIWRLGGWRDILASAMAALCCTAPRRLRATPSSTGTAPRAPRGGKAASSLQHSRRHSAALPTMESDASPCPTSATSAARPPLAVRTADTASLSLASNTARARTAWSATFQRASADPAAALLEGGCDKWTRLTTAPSSRNFVHAGFTLPQHRPDTPAARDATSNATSSPAPVKVFDASRDSEKQRARVARQTGLDVSEAVTGASRERFMRAPRTLARVVERRGSAAAHCTSLEQVPSTADALEQRERISGSDTIFITALDARSRTPGWTEERRFKTEVRGGGVALRR
mmetsp:Transcript_23342/g.54515  ORF Transcript_23342/g.54515 Transcript_23342/m.54515 type:complete len:293 (+) Transcript_23342:131-1009(+)